VTQFNGKEMMPINNSKGQWQLMMTI